ncbi:EamA family transporter RarD [Campylobacter vicugnae]|uniref:EamA family transporter RarD n=1 Tax=Campylobacter vicugnae TaxID=1660076 RepID=UPI002551C118|nr:EamA family transporter RarD [Campylobacter ovis]MDL0105016.1 EamA family transporter RarD [Campylobacter ovis]MDL0107182.1 EamA family transporter RarD [Campylobacter ovis]
MQATQKGFILALATFIMWGVFPIFFKFIEGIAATEVLAHRIIWSALILLVILIITKRLNSVKRIAKIKKVTLTLAITGALIASNWGVFIYAINQNEILATSLGYFINPLFSILLGAIILKEELSPALKLSIFIVFIAIGVQIYAIGNLPLISIILPLSFALYGLLRKRLGVRTFEGLFIETIILTPFALLYLLYLAINNSSEFGINFNGIMLFLSGFVTILPLLTFNASTKYLKLSTIGFLQYISPTLSMIIAVFIYNETLDFYKIISFALIWISLAIATISNLRRKNGTK